MESRIPLLSIIVPIYKVEKFIHECINSILSQGINDYELILIDDGSPDSSGEICEEYAKHCSNIIVIHKKNGGLSSARNAGIDIAKGTYITFIDSDDCIDLNTYKYNLKRIIDSDADFIQFPIVNKWTSKDENFLCMPENEIVSNQPLRELANQNLSGSVWNKIYKRDLIKDLRFRVGALHEDLLYILDVCQICKNVIISNKGKYLYRTYSYNYIKYPFSSELDFIYTHKYYYQVFMSYDKNVALSHWLWTIWLFIYKMNSFSINEQKILINNLDSIKLRWSDINYIKGIKYRKRFLIVKVFGIKYISKILNKLV